MEGPSAGSSASPRDAMSSTAREGFTSPSDSHPPVSPRDVISEWLPFESRHLGLHTSLRRASARPSVSSTTSIPGARGAWSRASSPGLQPGSDPPHRPHHGSRQGILACPPAGGRLLDLDPPEAGMPHGCWPAAAASDLLAKASRSPRPLPHDWNASESLCRLGARPRSRRRPPPRQPVVFRKTR
jgi:hypothetical protein